ncbi:tyrosine-protein phosphatase 10D [Plutella xylostella]|uniref:tyrosine-protein phosphatase 10D n=1 Tax=Plutella xylostella TaxID=51655 RepID=UPI002032B520|nr:tyrosine-protein phosphatase 10D [Plutella xylostella]
MKSFSIHKIRGASCVKCLRKEKVSCEIEVLPSMMWKRSIVQGAAGAALALLWLASHVGPARGADLVIEIPGAGAGGGAEGGRYRLDYRPPRGEPRPNFTVPARASTINFQGLPGTKYHFMLYYSNDSFTDLLTWNQTIITAPEPPTNLTVSLGRNKQATISWAPPSHGDYTGFRFKVIPLTGGAAGGGGAGGGEAARNITAEGGDTTHTLRELAPGGTYQLHAFTLLHDKESAAYASRNFTTKPNTPGKFIVWFRNETTLLVLWQPPYPPGQYTHYKVSIVPPDARDSELYVEKEGEPPGPAQAAFKGLVPGRAYNISVQTVSEPEISAPTTAQYRTVPLRPANVTVAALHETSFSVSWAPPAEPSEFEKYQVSLSGGAGGAGGARRAAPLLRGREEPPHARFDSLEPGAHYTVAVKTMSGKVTSWPQAVDLTLKPLPVLNLQWSWSGAGAALSWAPAPGSTQDSYRVSYHEVGPARDDANSLLAPAPSTTLAALLPGRNYSVQVSAVSRSSASNESVVHVLTPPLAPALRELTPLARALRLAWSSDVNSKQDSYSVSWRLLDGGAAAAGAVGAARGGSLATAEAAATVAGLLPGALYELSLRAHSHGQPSEPHVTVRAVRPLPPVSMSVERVSSNSAVVRWRGPAGSALGQFVLRYRTQGDAAWTRLPPLSPNDTEAEIVDMTHGERYTIQLDTASLAVAGERQESGAPLGRDHTVRPNPVSDVASLVDARNMTLEWPRPKGRVEWYSVRWWARDPAEGGGEGARNLTAAEGAAEGAGAGEGGAEGGRGTVRALIPGLASGVGYTVAIAAHSYNLTSDIFTMDTRTRPLIQSEMTIVTESDDSEDNSTLPAFLVVYTRTPASATVFDSYRFRLEGEAEAPRWESRAAAAPGQQLLLRGLLPGRLYNVTMWTVSHNVTSQPVQRQARLFPRPIPWLNASWVGAREIALAWGAPWGSYSDFLVQWLERPDRLASRAAPAPRLAVAGLTPHTNYTFTVQVRAGTPATLLTTSSAKSATFTTAEAPPGQLQKFQPLDSKPTSMTFGWRLPASEHNGVLRRFVIQYGPQGAPPSALLTAEFPPDARSGTVSGLTAGEAYSFAAWAESGAGAGAAARWSERMAIAAPPRPPASAVPSELRRTSTTVVVRFRSDYFSAANGNVTAYTLVVSEEPSNSSAARLPSWRDVARLPLWPPYQVTEPYYPFHSSAVEEFTIGSERCGDGGRAYCNGPLKPNTKYYVKLRAYTAPDKFTDTAYTVLYTDADNTAWIIGGCVAAALLAGAGGAALLARRRRGAGAAGAGGGAPAPRASRPVRVQDFIDHYRLMSADSDFRFSEEFEELKHVGREQPSTAADLPCNRPKNRFTNILPYDHSRYKLQPVDDEEGSDYINANFVPGFSSPREFIVTQGPLHCTRDDFWRMCWESGTRAIVMLTRCVEKGREKCDRYWPYDTRPVYYGDIAVTALNESRYPDWTVTELGASRGSEQRVLLHFHFTTWPDFGVPSPPTTLARFVRAFRDRVPPAPAPAPVVVHCSAGVGRSGTFIALDRALQQLAARHDALDVFGIVHQMRRERVWMVQTEQQYICIHQCLVAVLEGQELAQPPPNNHHLNQAYEDDEGIAESGM